MEDKTKLRLELLKMRRASLEKLVYEFTRVTDISLENLNITTAIDDEWVKIDSLRFYYGEDMYFCGKIDDHRDIHVEYDIFHVPDGCLIDTILTLESRLK